MRHTAKTDKDMRQFISSETLNVKQVYNHVQILNPKSAYRDTDEASWQLREDFAKELNGYLPSDSLAAKIIKEHAYKTYYSEKQMWVIAYELMKSQSFKEDYSKELSQQMAKEEAKRERERENRKKRAAAIKEWKEKKAAQATKAEEKKEEEPAKELNGIKKGDMVEHKKFGIGEVKQVNEKSFVIDFPKFGRKEIAAYFFVNK